MAKYSDKSATKIFPFIQSSLDFSKKKMILFYFCISYRSSECFPSHTRDTPNRARTRGLYIRDHYFHYVFERNAVLTGVQWTKRIYGTTVIRIQWRRDEKRAHRW